MKKDELIKTILSSSDMDSEMEKYLNSGEIEYNDILTETEQENLYSLFQSDIYVESRIYPRFPVFYRIQQYLNKLKIDLSQCNLNSKEKRTEILEALLQFIINEKNYTIHTVRILWEVVLSLDSLYTFLKSEKEIQSLYNTYFEISFDLFKKTHEINCFNGFESCLLTLQDLRITSKENDKISDYYREVVTYIEPMALKNPLYAPDYLINLVNFLEILNEENLKKEINVYLEKFVKFCETYSKNPDLSKVPIAEGVSFLFPKLKILNPTKNILKLINKLQLILETIINDRTVENETKISLLISLSYISLYLNDLKLAEDYLRQEAKLVQISHINRDTLTAFNMIGLLKSFKEKSNSDRYENLLMELYQIEPDDDLLAALTNGEIQTQDLFRKNVNNSGSTYENQKKSLEESEKEYKIRYDEAPNTDDLIRLIFAKIDLAFFSIAYNDFTKANNKIYESEELLEILPKDKILDDYNRTKFEIEFIKEFISFLTKEDSEIDKFIENTNNLINSLVRNYNIVFFLTSPISPLIKAAEVLIQREGFNSAFKLIEKINEEFKEFSAAQEDLDTVQSFLSVLVDLESFINDENKLESIEEIIKEVSLYLDKIYFSEIDFIVNNKYIGLAQNDEDKNDYDKSIEYYKKAIKLFLLYPDFQKNKTITYELGKGYLGLGNRQRELNQIDEAIKSYKNSINYLTKFNINKNDPSRLLDIIAADSNLAELYIDKEEYNISLEILEREDEIIKNFIEDIEDGFLFVLFLKELNLRFFVFQQLEKFDEQQKVFEDLLLLVNDDSDRFGLLPEVFRTISFFMNMNENVLGKPGNWSYLNYIEDVYKKLLKYNIPSKVENYPPDLQRGILNIYFYYLDYCIKQGKFISEKLLNQTIELGYQLAEIYPNDRDALLFNIKEFELFRDRNILNNSFTKKKKVFKKRVKKTAGRNKKKRKKRR